MGKGQAKNVRNAQAMKEFVTPKHVARAVLSACKIIDSPGSGSHGAGIVFIQTLAFFLIAGRGRDG